MTPDTIPGSPLPADLAERVRAWITDDPDAADRTELQDLLDAAARGDTAGEAAAADLADRFAGRLQFGTAGLRGAMGAGPNRMNRAVVRAATAGLARWLHEHQPPGTGVVLGWDARHRSAEFAGEAAAVLTGAGIPVHLLPGRSPTPLLAFAIRHLSTAAGVMITASHNPPADNGYKLYLGDGAQIIPPVDTEIEAAIRSLGPLPEIPLGPDEGPLITRHGDEIAQAYLDAILAASPGVPPPAGRVRDVRVVYTSLHGVAGPLMLRAIERAGYPAPYVVPAQAEPDPDFPTVSFPNPEEPGALDLALADARRLEADLVLASDPDGDRLAVAVPDPEASGGWRKLTGDQVGGLLGAFVLDAAPGQAPRAQSAPGQSAPGRGPDPPARPPPGRVWLRPPWCRRRCCPRSPIRPGSVTRRPLLASSGSSGPRTTSLGRGSYSDTRRRSGTRSVTWCGIRTGSAPRSPCSGWRRRPGRPASRCWIAGMRWSRRTGCT